jgi:hypothetical protein
MSYSRPLNDLLHTVSTEPMPTESEKFQEIDLKSNNITNNPVDENDAHDFVQVERNDCTRSSIANEKMSKLIFKFDKKFGQNVLKRMDSFLFRLKSKFKKKMSTFDTINKLAEENNQDHDDDLDNRRLSFNYYSLKLPRLNEKSNVYKQSKSFEFNRLTRPAFMDDFNRENEGDEISAVEQESTMKELFADKCIYFANFFICD